MWIKVGGGGNDVVNPIQPNIGVTVLPSEAFPGQRSDKAQEILVPAIERKQEVPTAREEIPREEIEKAAEKLNRLMGLIDKQLKFSIHETTHRVMVKIIDRQTGDVLDEIPSKQMMDLLGSFNKMVGIFFDKYL
ncbi:flagellar protein FlaG [Desulfitobacterium sp.]|uniref:flagellar protein FlaG n=1 Tax=Desulfitobacterium sp. TaxID=49981 RepID=UPI002CEE5732|nr:flagellar protein FlaG [Desulfitobacterium sp.]HVJ50754.1 flagellar protein FlaG [Desulfitobacterium sp.]